MSPNTRYTIRVALIVAMGGFLMGFDASVISGVVTFIGPEFGLSNIELGWAVASLTLTATLAMMVSGPLSDRYGRLVVLKWAAVLFLVSAIGSALGTAVKRLRDSEAESKVVVGATKSNSCRTRQKCSANSSAA